jgi:hypothetical protein
MNFIDADERPTPSELEFFWCRKAYAFQALKAALETDTSDVKKYEAISRRSLKQTPEQSRT